jgi:glucose/arabinose dehydrogenase
MNRVYARRAVLFAFVGIAAAGVLRVGAQRSVGPRELGLIRLPAGFQISVWADVPGARSMSLSPTGTLFVGTQASNVYALQDVNGDGSAERRYTIATGLNTPNGVAFHNDALYVAEIHQVLRFDGIEKALGAPPRPVAVNASFPTDEPHGWKFIRFGPDGLLYVPVGAPCNVCEVGPRHGAIFRMRPDGTGFETFARGVRNTVGFDWDPATKELWFTDNGRDRMGDDVPNDELNHAPRAGLHFGFPYCHQGDVADPMFGSKRACGEFAKPVQLLGPHVAALGMRFYTGSLFPQQYRGAIFIAQHGSWNRTEKIGYRVVVAHVQGGKVSRLETFAEGWLQGQQEWGRPVDVEVRRDGSLLVSDDEAGKIYRITYRR